jgi:hypothetical protein
MYEAICEIYIRIDKAPLHEDTKGGTKLEEIVGVVRVHQKLVIAAASVDEVFICIPLSLVLGSGECSMHYFGEAFNYLRRRSPFGSLEGREKINRRLVGDTEHAPFAWPVLPSSLQQPLLSPPATKLQP